MRTLAFVFLLVVLAIFQSEKTQQTAQAVEAKLHDPRQVVSDTCAPASSPLCRCIVGETFKTLQSGPREILAIVQRPGAVWDEWVQSLDPAVRDHLISVKAAAEAACRRRASPGSGPGRLTTMDRMARAAAQGQPKRSIRASCLADGGSSKACACYEQTLGAALPAEEFEVVRRNGRFPPLPEDLPAGRQPMTQAAMAAARSACGVGAT